MTDETRAARPACGEPLTTELELRYVDISQIKPYERNPRRAENAEYDRIKTSIRRDGIGQPLVVTQRPGETDYVVHAGGNTRLRILKELFAATGDPQFGSVACVFRPWTREADVLLAHLKENDLRGELTFVDKALAMADAKALLEEEEAGELNQTRLAEILKDRGYGLSQGSISQMAYVVGRLLPLLPQALEAGIGRPQVTRIRALDRVARALWLARSIDTEGEYEAVFGALCQRYDTPDWDLGNLRRALEAEIAERGEINIHAVSIELGARLEGRSVIPADAAWGFPDDDIEDQMDDAWCAPGETETVKPPASGSAPRNTCDAPSPKPSHTPPSPAPGGLNTERGEAPDDHDTAPATAAVPLGSPALQDVKSLRARLWTLASRLAQRNGLGDLIEPLSGQGLGFVLRDVPDPALVEQLDEESLAQVSMVWWHLAACAEMTVAPLESLLPALPEESVLRRALVDQDAGLLFASVWTLDPGHAGFRLWQRLADCDWQDCLALMDTYRALRRLAAADGQDLWSPTM